MSNCNSCIFSWLSGFPKSQYESKAYNCTQEWQLGEIQPDSERNASLHSRNRPQPWIWEALICMSSVICQHISLFLALKPLKLTLSSNSLPYIKKNLKVMFRHRKHLPFFFFFTCRIKSLLAYFPNYRQIQTSQTPSTLWGIIIWMQIPLWSYKRGLQFQLINLKPRSWIITIHDWSKI